MENKKILITHCLPDDNPGGLAILWGTIRALSSYSQGADIKLLSLYSSENPRTETAYRHTRRKYPELAICGSILKHRTEHDAKFSGLIGRVYKAIFWPLDLIRSFFGLLFPSLLRNQKTVAAFRDAEIIVSRGSHIVFDNPDSVIRSIFGIYMLVFPLLLAKRLGKKYFMYAHSISALQINFNIWLFRYTMKNCEKILIREKITQEIMINYYGIEQEKVVLVPDAAFAFDTPDAHQKKSVISRWKLPYEDYLAVTVVKWNISKEKTEACLDGMATTIDWMLDNGHVSKCVLVLQVREGPAKWEDDRPATEELFRRIRNKDQTIIIEDDWIPEDLICIYGGAKLTMVTRFHSLMFTLLGNTPPLAISFSGPKTKGLMEWMGLNEYTLEQSDFKFENAKQKIEDILLKHGELKKQIKNNVDRRRILAYKSPYYII